MCSVIGIVGDNCLDDLVLACEDLQHRGSDSAGLIIFDTGDNEVRNIVRGLGSSDEVFGNLDPGHYKGDMGIAHGRYVTKGHLEKRDVQPNYTQWPGLALGFNGQINNYEESKSRLKQEGLSFFTGNDLEPLLFTLAHNLRNLKEWEAKDPETFFHEKLCTAIGEMMRHDGEQTPVSGAYAAVGLMPGRGVFGFRDPYGIRPLEFGYKTEPGQRWKKRYMIASETHPMDRMGYNHDSEVRPGEILFIDTERNVHRKIVHAAETATPCVFELVYFSKGISENRGKPIRDWREQIGRHFARNNPHLKNQCDIVTAIPKTPIPCGEAIAQEFGLPYSAMEAHEGTGRTFLANTQAEREKMARHKFGYVRKHFAGRRVLVVDDSLVRGTVSSVVIEQLFDRGASEVHMAIMHGQYQHPCPYGIDTPHGLISAICGGDLIRIAEAIKPEKYADRKVTVTFNARDALLASLELQPGKACAACIDGIYPTGEKYIQGHLESRTNEIKNPGKI